VHPKTPILKTGFLTACSPKDTVAFGALLRPGLLPQAFLRLAALREKAPQRRLFFAPRRDLTQLCVPNYTLKRNHFFVIVN
jgi:hypothetical protein